MDFEQRVQEHNVDIAFIRDGIRDLPSEEEIREQASSGKYVWKKYELKVIRFKVTSSSNARGWWFSSDDIDFGTVTNEFFDGITFVANGVTITITPTEFSYGGNKSPYTWNPSSKHIVTQTNYVHADVNVEAEKEKKTFVAYATNDSPTAYPDNVEKDGYWWEEVNGVRYGVLFESINSQGYPTKAKINIDIDFVYTLDGYSYVSELMRHIEDLELGLISIRQNFAGNLQNCNRLKILTNCKTIYELGLSGFGLRAMEPKVFIPNTVEDIIGYTASNLAFNNANSKTKIYCEAQSKPSTWDNYWNYTTASTVLSTVWGVTEAEFDAL